MRTTADRIRHAVSFELIILLFATPIGHWIVDRPMLDVGAVILASALVAVVWAYAFNLGFDHLLLRHQGHARKSWPQRVVHALSFELGLVVMLAPLIAWFLEVTLIQAVIMDLALSAFYVVYTFGFNLAYDAIFPVPDAPADLG